VIPVGVTVTFLRMERRPVDPSPPLPEGAEVRVEQPCPLELYRKLYNTVGQDYVWWLRRTLPDAQLAALLRNPRVSVHVLHHEGAIAGFYELDRSSAVVNLNYFGLMPHAIGHHLGYALLRHAIDTAWDSGATAMTVNTCTADHPRALPTYQRAGFRITRRVDEEWPVPARLGLNIPDHLKL
jgi:GNAT superfamily N-acetyltransferase